MSGRWLLFIASLVIGGAIGLYMGFSVRAVCPTGPVAGAGELVANLAIVTVAGVLLITSGILALLRRGGAAVLLMTAAAIGLAAGYGTGLTFAADPCGPPTEAYTAGRGVLTLGDPYAQKLQGNISCAIDLTTGRVGRVAGGVSVSDDPASWRFDETQVDFELPLAAGGDVGIFFDLMLVESNRAWGYRATRSEQVEVSRDGPLRGSMTFDGLPLLEETRPAGAPVPDELDGQLTWRCDSPAHSSGTMSGGWFAAQHQAPLFSQPQPREAGPRHATLRPQVVSNRFRIPDQWHLVR